MAQTFFPLPAPVEIVAAGMPNPGDFNVWKELDLQTLAGIPSTATGVIFHVEHYYLGAETKFGIRKTGSTDDIDLSVCRDSHFWGMVGVNTSGHVDVFIKYQDRFFIYIVGYTIAGVTFRTNSVDISPGFGLTDTWVDTDLSSYAPGAIGVIVEIGTAGLAVGLGAGIRMHGSTDERRERVCNHCWAIIGCDANQHIDLNKYNENVWFYLVGYITIGAVFLVNADDVSLTAPFAQWKDIAVANVFAFVECVSPVLPQNFGIRKDGSSENITRDLATHAWAIVEVSSGFIEGYAQDSTVDFFTVGYGSFMTTPGFSRAHALSREEL